ncbi:hypothetical protein POM88_031774 [Heracleum sosnowskyi]|uniref:Cation efflux protein transmembrane domain-containing protein n=1 Tax=Heracleum sosnowskyi TaxID=360622 RepID=A0AAD8HZE8_9APIA|nr:hypothetical protein POM88_031774 [Heracleum sosnowskyi]
MELHEDLQDVQDERTAIVKKVCICKLFDEQTSLKDDNARLNARKRLILALVLILMTVEVTAGLKANSLAILTDATHLSDVVTFGISLFSLWAAVGWTPTHKHSYVFFCLLSYPSQHEDAPNEQQGQNINVKGVYLHVLGDLIPLVSP